jgi:hypothetical protein
MGIAHKLVCQLVETDAGSLDDLVPSFIEQECGRHDWRANWKQLRSTRDMVEHARCWLSNLKISADPQALVDEIDRLVEQEKGNWIG